jgi:hypothetical protein
MSSPGCGGFVGWGEEGPAALVIDGEAGIGKSTLWLAGVDLAREAGMRVLSLRPAEDCSPQTFSAGQSFYETAANPFTVKNESKADAVVLVTFVVPGGDADHRSADGPAAADELREMISRRGRSGRARLGGAKRTRRRRPGQRRAARAERLLPYTAPAPSARAALGRVADGVYARGDRVKVALISAAEDLGRSRPCSASPTSTRNFLGVELGLWYVGRCSS